MTPKQARVAALEEIAGDTWFALRAAENWQKQYQRTPDQFKLLVRTESHLLLALKRYFNGLADRAYNFVDWSVYRQQVIKAYDVVVNIDEQEWQDEEQVLYKVFFNDIAYMTLLGTQAGAVLYKQDLSLTVSDQLIQNAAHSLTDKLVQQVSGYTRKQIEDSIATSLKLGESIEEATSRLEFLKDPVRAERIARTESVRSWNAGIKEYGGQTGATGQTWLTVDDPCPVCEENADQTVALDETFNSGDDAPPAHPNCRCGLKIEYPVDQPVDDTGNPITSDTPQDAFSNFTL